MILWPVITFVFLLILRFGVEPLVKTHEPAAYVQPSERILTVATVVALSFVIDLLIRKFYWQGLARRRNRETPSLIQDIVTIALVLAGLSIGLWWQAGLDLTGVAAASGAVAFVLGIALQPVIQDLFGGLSINFEGSYMLGDWISVYSEDLGDEPIYGRVSGMTWRATFLTLENGTRLMIPNSMATSKPVVNHSRPPTPKRLSVELSVDNRLPADRVLDMLLGEALKATRQPGLARTPEPTVLLKALDQDALFFEVRFYHYPDQITPGSAKSIVLRSLHDVIQQNEVPMAVTQIEVASPPDFEFVLGEEEIYDALSNVDIFQNALDKSELRELSKHCVPQELSAGSVLMRQGDTARSMFVILEGAAAISIPDPKGGAHEVAISATGDVAGEMSLLTGAPRSATVTALTRLRVVEITKEALELLLKKKPELLDRFSRILAQRQHELDEHANKQANQKKTENDLLARMRAAFSNLFGKRA